jgi:pimeloyl-ACP methyl ester carboxylesterase
VFNFRRDAPPIEAGLLTPSELYRDYKSWRRVFGHRPLVLPWQVRPWRREILSPGVTLYTADRSVQTLIVGFCGRHDHLFLPAGVFLQTLDHERFDLVTAWDARHLHFDHGIEGYARSLPELARRLSEFAAARGYDRIITYGISMGGLAALRAGQLMGADRAIAAGGRFAWNVGRMLRNEAHIQAFDLLCHCRQPDATESYAIFSEDNAEDAESAERLAAICTDCSLIPLPYDDHNFPHGIQKARRLDEYHREIFDLSRKPDPSVLRRLLKKRSRLDLRRTFYIKL